MSEKLTPGKGFVRISNARLPEQKKVMRQIIKDGVCPFCVENLATYHKEPILKEGKYWLLTKNQWPYEDTKQHIIAITKVHIESLNELEPEAGAELITLFQEISEELGITGGGIALRFGDNDYASTVTHLHAHLIQPDLDKPEHNGIKFSLSKAKS